MITEAIIVLTLVALLFGGWRTLGVYREWRAGARWENLEKTSSIERIAQEKRKRARSEVPADAP